MDSVGLPKHPPAPPPPKECWLCTFSHCDLAKDLNDFSIHNVPRMSCQVVAEQMHEQIMRSYGRAQGASVPDILRHLREHVVHPLVSLSIHARSLSSLAESLRENLFERDPETGQVIVDAKNSELYLKTVSHLCNLYKSDNGRLLFNKS